MENFKYIEKYRLNPVRLGEIFQVNQDLEGLETWSAYCFRVRKELASYMYSCALLQHKSPVYLSEKLSISVRTMQRYIKEIPISNEVLIYIYNLQVCPDYSKR